MKILIIAIMLLSSGCARFGVTAYADLSESVSGSVKYNIDGHGKAPGPRARAGIEADVKITDGLKAAAGVEHYSFPFTTADRGEERGYLGLRYHWGAK